MVGRRRHVGSARTGRRLVEEPELIPTAVEEFLRAYAPVTMAREVVKDKTINGCPMKSGEMVLLSFPAANRDPKMFPDADRVVIDVLVKRIGSPTDFPICPRGLG